MRDLGVLSALDPPLGLEESLAGDALAALPEDDGRGDLLLLACLMLAGATAVSEHSGAAMLGLLDEMEFTAADRDRAWAGARRAPELVEPLSVARTASEVYAATHGATLEAVALAAALADRRGSAGAQAARRWLAELRHVRLQISGDDLLAAGAPAGPEIGRRLEQALRRKLDGELVDGREAELRAAMEGPRADEGP